MSYLDLLIIDLAAIGSSKEPGTHTISRLLLDSEISTPCLFKQSKHPDNSFDVTKSLNLATTIPNFNEAESVKEPS